jgi:hypothetical protein
VLQGKAAGGGGAAEERGRTRLWLIPCWNWKNGALELLQGHRVHIYRPKLGPSYTRGPRPINNPTPQLQSSKYEALQTL